MKDDVELDLEVESSHYSLMGGNLVITNPIKSQHVGKYFCLATNKYGTVISQEASVQFGCKLYPPRMLWWCTMQSCTFMHIMQFFQIKSHQVLKVILRKSFWVFVSASRRPRSFLIGGEGVGVRQRGAGGSAALCSPTTLSRYSMLELRVSSCWSFPAGPSSRCLSLWLNSPSLFGLVVLSVWMFSQSLSLSSVLLWPIS